MTRTAAALLLIVLAAGARAGEVAPPAAEALRVGVPSAPDAVAGFDRSLFAEAAREAGLGVAFDVMPPEAALAALDAGRIDLAAGPYPPDAATAARRALQPVAEDGDALVKRRGDGGLKAPEDAAGKLLGILGPPADVPRLRAAAARLGARVAPAARAFADPLGDLAAGRRAALVGPLRDVAAAALARPEAFEVVGPAFGRRVRLAPLVRADRPEHAGQLDAALARMTADGRLADLQRRWFGTAFGQPSGQGLFER